MSLRIPKMDFKDLGYEPGEGEVVIAVDATAVKVTNRGEWMRKKRKGYIKIHVAVDIVTKQVVSLEVSEEKSHDGEKLKPLVRKAQRKEKVKRILGDGGYDSKANFQFLEGCGIEVGIKVRQGSDPNFGGAREKVVGDYIKDPPGWKEGVGYGQRWMVERFFSGLGRLFGEVVEAKRFEGMVKEMGLKVWVYNLMLGLATAKVLYATGA